MIEFLICILLGFGVAQVATLVTTAYLHRASTHKAVKFHPAVEFIFQLILWLTTGIKRLEWVAVHLCHHAHTDVDGDPHSPVLLGFWRVQLANPLLYRRAARDPKVLEYGRNIRLSLVEQVLFSSSVSGLVLGILILCLLLGLWQGIVVAITHAIFYLQLNSLVNAYCHKWGYKNFPLAYAFNSLWVGLITGGEGFHNNHHHKPTSARLGLKLTEPDIGWGFIRLLQTLRLAKING